MEMPHAIDRYVIESVLGEGGMGRVYLAFDPRLGRRVALKVVLTEGPNERARAVARARTMREARAAAAFNHPNVVAVYDVGEVDGNPYIAMEFVAGRTLRDCLASKHVPEPQKLAWLLEVARGLGAAHRAGLVHRDVKPENVMITEENVAKILDFGIARSTEVEGVEPVDPTAPTFATITARGVTVGTPQYMPPEQLNAEPLDGRADQFAWGVLAWEALVGSLPWGAKTGAQLITAVLAQPVPTLAEVVPGIDVRVSAAIARALEKSRDDRFATMEDLLHEIEGEDMLRPSPGSSARLPALRFSTGPGLAHVTLDQRPAKRGRLAIALAAGIPLVVGLTWVALRGLPGTKNPGAPSAASVASTTSVAADVAPYFARAAADEGEGRHDEACLERRHASDAYPTSADAALAATLCFRDDATAGRPYFRRAWVLRSALSPRDAAVLDAYEPFFQRGLVDTHEELARLEAAVARFPNDARLHYYLAGSYRLDSAEVKRAIGEIDKSIALDPTQPHVLSIGAEFHSYDGDFAGSRAMIDRCLRTAPGAIECLKEGQWLDSEEGECGKTEAAARRMLAIDPNFADGVRSLANALYARGTSTDTVRTLLDRIHTPDASVLDGRLDEIKTSILAGDFVNAPKVARALADDAKGSLVAADHGMPARLLVAIDHESGRDAEAAAVARKYLEGRDAWEPAPSFDDWAMLDEPTPLMLAARLRVNAITRAEYDAELAKTVQSWTSRVPPTTRSFVWMYAYANPAETAIDAQVAVAREPEFDPLSRFKPLSLADEAIGRAYALAGRTDDAIATLTRATHTCFPVDFPIEHTRAHYFLGVAEEAKGDVPAACAAYRVVRERWGEARPRSVTAELAAARITALKCPR